MNTLNKDAIGGIVRGIVLIAAACWFWHFLVGNPLHELALIRHGQSTEGFVVGAGEDAESGDEGGTVWFHSFTDTYRLPDGREFTRIEAASGRLPENLRDLNEPIPMQVEYLPGKPGVSRLKGSGAQTVFEWVWRKALLGVVLLGFALSLGISMLSKGIRDWKATRAGAPGC